MADYIGMLRRLAPGTAVAIHSDTGKFDEARRGFDDAAARLEIVLEWRMGVDGKTAYFRVVDWSELL